MRIRRSSLLGGALIALGLAIPALSFAPVGAASSAIVGTASAFGVLAGSEVTNTGATVVEGGVGVSPGTAISGFPPGISDEPRHSADGVAQQAQSDLTVGYNDLAGRTSTNALAAGIGTLTLSPGVHTASSDLLLTGTLTLDADGDEDALFIFQVGSALTTATDSVVLLVDGASACNVYWQVGSSATLGTDSTFVGTLVALTSITANTDATIEGQLLARNGAVTLDTNVIDSTTCATAQADNGGSTTTTSSSTTSTSTAPTSTTTASTPTPTTPTTVTPGGSTTGTPAPAPRLPETGPSTVPAIAAVLLVLVGTLLVWIGRPALLHSTRRWFR